MYNYQDIEVLHLEITSKCQASCPMCARNIQGGPLNPFLELNEIDFKMFTKWFDVDFLKRLKKIYFCGNFGDPVISKDLIKILKHIKIINKSCQLSINTNGSARDKKFWIDLARLTVSVRFGIDGMDDTHNRYRIGTDWNKIIQNAIIFISNGGHAIWDMLVFEHNEHQVELCRTLSKDLGFAEFQSKHTSRFRDNILNVIDRNGKPIDLLSPTKRSLELKSKINLDPSTISCKVKKEKSLYVGANGNVTPCCWLDQQFIPFHNPSRIDIYSKFDSIPNLNKLTLREIFDQKYFSSIEDSWRNIPLKECSKQCGSFKKFEEQFDDVL